MGALEMSMGLSPLHSFWLRSLQFQNHLNSQLLWDWDHVRLHSLVLSLPSLNPFHSGRKKLHLPPSPWRGCILQEQVCEGSKVAPLSPKHKEWRCSGLMERSPCLPGLPLLLRAQPLRAAPEVLRWGWGWKWKPWLPHGNGPGQTLWLCESEVSFCACSFHSPNVL